MREILKELLQLQDVDTRLNAARAQLKAFPRRLAEVDAQLAEGKAQLAKSKESHSTALKERKKYELDVEQWKEKARKYRDQAYQVKTNEAFKALQHEAEMAEAQIAKSEDRLLEEMVSSEQYDRQVKAAEKKFHLVEEEARGERTKIEGEKSVVEKELSRLESERVKAVAVIPEELLDHYERIAKRHGGVAVAAIRGESCGACGAHIRPHVFQELRREDNSELYHCELCTRILYYVEPSVAEASAQEAAQTSERS